MIERLRILPARFFRLASGKEPVRDWLNDLSDDDKKRIGHAIRDCEFSWPIGMPLCRSIQGHAGLWEVRANLGDGCIGRVFFCVHDGEMVLLHGIKKKTQKTPKKELELAVSRQKELSDE